MSISASEARQRLFPLLEQVNTDHQPVRITSRAGDAVLMSAERLRLVARDCLLAALSGERRTADGSRRSGQEGAMITAALVFAGTGRVAARLHLHDGVADLDQSRAPAPRSAPRRRKPRPPSCSRSTKASTTCSWRSSPASASPRLHGAQRRRSRARIRRRRIHGLGGGRAAGVVTGQSPRRADPGRFSGDRVVLLVVGLVVVIIADQTIGPLLILDPRRLEKTPKSRRLVHVGVVVAGRFRGSAAPWRTAARWLAWHRAVAQRYVAGARGYSARAQHPRCPTV